MAQLKGSDSRIIVRKERTFKTIPTVSIHPCELVWDEFVAANVVATADATVYKKGTKSCKLAVAAGASTGILASDNIASTDLSHCTKVGMWIRSSVALSSGDLKLLLDDTALCASPLETINIPAVAAGEINTWKYVKLTLAAAGSDTAIISVGINMAVDKGAFDFYVDDIRGLEGDAVIIPFNNAKMGLSEALEDSAAISSGRQPLKPVGGAITGSGTTSHEFNPYMAVLLKHILGSVTTTDLTGSKYSHVMTIGDLGEGLAIEIQHRTERQFTLYHCKGNGFSLSQAATGKVTLDCTWEIAAEEVATNETQLDGDPTNYGHKPFSSKFGIFTEGGVAAPGLATNFTVNYNNNISGEPTIGSEGQRDSLTEGMPKIDFSVDMLYKDNTYMDKAKALTESKIKLENLNGTGVGTLGNEYAAVEMTEILYARPQQNIDGPKGLKANFTGIAYFDDDAGGTAITVTIRNSQAVVE